MSRTLAQQAAVKVLCALLPPYASAHNPALWATLQALLRGRGEQHVGLAREVATGCIRRFGVAIRRARHQRLAGPHGPTIRRTLQDEGWSECPTWRAVFEGARPASSTEDRPWRPPLLAPGQASLPDAPHALPTSKRLEASRCGRARRSDDARAPGVGAGGATLYRAKALEWTGSALDHGGVAGFNGCRQCRRPPAGSR